MNILLQQHGTNCCNNRLKELKHLKHTIAKLGVKHMKQRFNKKTLATTWNSYCNMRLKQLKHFKNIIATFVPSI